MGRPVILDLFCGAGGAAMGYSRAGFDVIGVDINPQKNYPFMFIKADVMALDLRVFAVDAVHASPPCQKYSVLRRANPGAVYPDYIATVRSRLTALGLPWVIENVPGAPLHEPTVLCGSMFGARSLSGDGKRCPKMWRQLRRHRLFETSFVLDQPACTHKGEALGVYGGGPVGRYTFENGGKKDRYGRRGGYQGTVAEKQKVMGIDWMNGTEINQAIPPAYTEFVGKQLLEHLRKAA